jgi:mannose-6-phosphate isomerase
VHDLVGVVRHYDWGDEDYLPALFGVPPDGRPWAEWWLGTHPGGPAHLTDGRSLAEVVGEMDILAKVLAARAPLSLQTHPTREQARAGWRRENAAGIALDDPRRIYRDEHDKPELLVALTDFEALCGFRDPAAAISDMERLGWGREARVLGDEGIAGYLAWALGRSDPPTLDRTTLTEHLVTLARHHPGDPGLRVAPLLNHVRLAPGEALALPAGNLHAYLGGAGVEVMTASDNVVRAAFTTKHVDVGELLAVVDVSVLVDPVVRPIADGDVTGYVGPAGAFSLERIDLDGEHRVSADARPRIMLVTSGAVSHRGTERTKGRACLVEAGEEVRLSGRATVWICGGVSR